MDKYDEFLFEYEKIYNAWSESSYFIWKEAQSKIDSLIDCWSEKHPECRGYFMFRRQLRCFEKYMNVEWVKHNLDFFRKTDEQLADDEFDEAVKLV